MNGIRLILLIRYFQLFTYTLVWNENYIETNCCLSPKVIKKEWLKIFVVHYRTFRYKSIGDSGPSNIKLVIRFVLYLWYKFNSIILKKKCISSNKIIYNVLYICNISVYILWKCKNMLKYMNSTYRHRRKIYKSNIILVCWNNETIICTCDRIYWQYSLVRSSGKL